MQKLKNIKSAILEIGQLLAQNPKIVSLLSNDQVDVLNHIGEDTITLNDLINEKYIALFPPTETAIKDEFKNTFLILLLDSVAFSHTDNNTYARLLVYIVSDINSIILTDNKNRLLELSEAIIDTLENVKLSSSGIIRISSMDYTIMTPFKSGYRIELTINDQNNGLVEI